MMILFFSLMLPNSSLILHPNTSSIKETVHTKALSLYPISKNHNKDILFSLKWYGLTITLL